MEHPELYETDRTKSKKDIEDPELLKDVISILEDDEAAEEAVAHLENDCSATAYVALVDPYNKKAYWSNALTDNRKVPADVTVELGSRAYSGRVIKRAYDIFNPENYPSLDVKETENNQEIARTD